MKKNPLKVRILFLVCLNLLTINAKVGFCQLANVAGGGSISMEYQVSSPGEGINLDVISPNFNTTNCENYIFQSSTAVATARSSPVGFCYSAGGTLFSLTTQSGAQAQVYGAPQYHRYASARGTVGGELALTFSNLVVFKADGHAGGSASATEGGGASGGGHAQIIVDGGLPLFVDAGVIEGHPANTADFHVSGLCQSLALNTTAASTASGDNYLDLEEDSLGAGAGGSSVIGQFDPDVVNPGSLSGTIFTNFLGNLLGNCMVIAKYPHFVTYTGKTRINGNIEFNPLEGQPTFFGGLEIADCTVIYSLGATQRFSFGISYQMMAKGPLVRFADCGQTTAKVDYPAAWSKTCFFITNMTFQPPSGSMLPVGTNQGVATWYSSRGLSGACPFDIIVKPCIARPELALDSLRNEFPNDSDGDGMLDWQELVAGTETLDASSVLAFSTPVLTPTNITLSWPTIPGIRYQLELGGLAGGFSPVGSVVTGMLASGSAQIAMPLVAEAMTNRLYRLRVVTE